ncbi:MAG: hypothetical protein FWD82_05265 [Defluviitaleaceae bacterium]|nr:hypothetical protein [Defluviitaleaceae bacterium]
MKRLCILAIILTLGLSSLASCTQPLETKTYSGFIEIRDNRLYITPVEVFIIYDAITGDGSNFFHDTSSSSIIFIERNDTQKLQEFGLTLYDFPSGIHIRPNWHSEEHWHYVEQAGIEALSFEVAANTEFIFVDNLLLFDTDEDGNRLHTTNTLENFMEYFFPTVVHFIEVQNGNLIRLVQEFAFTM